MSQIFKSEMEFTPSPHAISRGYSIYAAYFMWYCLGYIGLHNFYLKRFFHGLINSTLFTVGFLTIPQKFGAIFLATLAVLLIIDFIHLPGLIKDKNSEILRGSDT